MHHDLIVIGGGPAGYIGAIRAAQLGLNVACVEREPLLGGTCLRVGCIPSKALLESSHLYEMAQHDLAGRGIAVQGVGLDLEKMHEHRTTTIATLAGGIAGLFAKHGITHYAGHATFTSPKAITVDPTPDAQAAEIPAELTADRFLICTGSQPSSLPGIEIDEDRIVSSTGALELDTVPKRLVVIGAGYIGLELGTVWRRLGAEVVVLEYLDRILPGMDAELAKEALKVCKRQGLDFRLKTKVVGVERTGEGVRVQIEGGDPIEADRVLMAVGRRPNTEKLGLDAAGVTTDDRGFIDVNGHWQTDQPHIFAVGDVVGGAMLAHKAEEEAVACVEHFVTGYGHIDYDLVPGVVYTEPEIATIGRTEEQLKADGTPYKRGKFPFAASGRARAMGETIGFVKVLAHAETDRILGVHMIGPHVGELIAEAAAAMSFGASSEDLARTCHAHPTLAEALKEACLGVEGRTLNL